MSEFVPGKGFLMLPHKKKPSQTSKLLRILISGRTFAHPKVQKSACIYTYSTNTHQAPAMPEMIFCVPAIMQSIARKNKWPLDKMALSVDVTKKTKDDYGHPPREGAYVHGLYMEGK